MRVGHQPPDLRLAPHQGDRLGPLFPARMQQLQGISGGPIGRAGRGPRGKLSPKPPRQAAPPTANHPPWRGAVPPPVSGRRRAAPAAPAAPLTPPRQGGSDVRTVAVATRSFGSWMRAQGVRRSGITVVLLESAIPDVEFTTRGLRGMCGKSSLACHSEFFSFKNENLRGHAERDAAMSPAVCEMGSYRRLCCFCSGYWKGRQEFEEPGRVPRH